jgi:hypothetical protein
MVTLRAWEVEVTLAPLNFVQQKIFEKYATFVMFFFM